MCPLQLEMADPKACWICLHSKITQASKIALLLFYQRKTASGMPNTSPVQISESMNNRMKVTVSRALNMNTLGGQLEDFHEYSSVSHIAYRIGFQP